MSEEIKNNANAEELNSLLAIRRQKLADLQAEGKDPFAITKYDVTHHSQDVKDNYAELEGKTVSIAGRLMSKRVTCINVRLYAFGKRCCGLGVGL